MSDYETASGVPAYIAGLSEFVRAHYERRIESIEDQADDLRHRVAVLEAAITAIGPDNETRKTPQENSGQNL